MVITKVTQQIENLAVRSKLAYFLASQYYREVIKKEICLARIKRDDHVLFVGGGSCPFSAILMHQYTGARVTVIDHNISCVRNAKEAICRLGLERQVNVLCREGSDLSLTGHKDQTLSDNNLSDYTVIHFALQITPLEYVFSQVKRWMKPGARLLLRRPKACLETVYSACPQLKSCPYIDHKTCNIGSTLLFVKKECLYEDKECLVRDEKLEPLFPISPVQIPYNGCLPHYPR